MADEHDTTALAERAPAALHPMVAEVLRQNPTPEALQQLMAMQERWEDRKAEQAYTRALVALRKSLPPYLIRDAEVDFTSMKGRTHYRHTSLAAGMVTIQPGLIENGFTCQWKVARTTKGDVAVSCILRHEEGHSEVSTLEAPPDNSGNKSAPQAIASTQTLLQRYTLFGLLGLATKDQTEPGDSPPVDDPAAVDTVANRAMALAVVKAGRTRAAAEELVGRMVPGWTSADLDKIRSWLEPPTAPETDEPIDAQLVDCPPGPVVPVGRNKGKPVSSLSDDALNAAISWAEGHKESEFLDTLNAEVERRAMR